MFSNTEAFALLAVMGAIDEQSRRVHAQAVVHDLGLDPRLEPFIPLPPSRKRKLRVYESVLGSYRGWSALPEPARTRTIEQLARALRGG